MKISTIAPIALALALTGCNTTEQSNNSTSKTNQPSISTSAQTTVIDKSNPFFNPFNTEFGLAPFADIKDEHFLPAFTLGIEQSRNEIEAIANSKEPATFINTIEALENSSRLLTKVASVFYNLTGANTNPTIQKVNAEVSPLLSALNDDLLLNDKLFQRVKVVYDNRDEYTLNTAQAKLLTDQYANFIRGGANLNSADKLILRDLNAQLSKLAITFGDNLLAETNRFTLLIDKKSDLAGLPQGIIDAAAQTAAKNGHDSQWMFTTHRPSFTPFMTYAENRDLRRKMLAGYSNRANNDNANDNKAVLAKIASLRVKRANLLGYKSHADYILSLIHI